MSIWPSVQIQALATAFSITRGNDSADQALSDAKGEI